MSWLLCHNHRAPGGDPPGAQRVRAVGPGPDALGSGQCFATPTASLSPASTLTDRARVSVAIMSRQASTSAT